MKVLVVNCGSSSLKCRVFDLAADVVLMTGSVERIGGDDAHVHLRSRTLSGPFLEHERRHRVVDHREAFALLRAALQETSVGSDGELDAIGHRVTHGGERYSGPVRIDADVLAEIRALEALAPLHNPVNRLGIELCLEAFPGVPEVAVFDTAFHQSMPAHAYRYAVPEWLYTEHAVRRYGFHGTSHGYVSRRTAAHLGRPVESLNLITLHLGNGASAAAIRSGRCVDTSMGMTPLEGLVMGSRSGDLDPSLPLYIARIGALEVGAVENLLNSDSGLKGLCGENDMRGVLERVARRDVRAELALDVYCYRICKYVGAYAAVLTRVDALVFGGGVGENSPEVRERVCAGLAVLGAQLDLAKNLTPADDVAELQAETARLKILRVRTDEEREIAEQTRALLASVQS